MSLFLFESPPEACDKRSRVAGAAPVTEAQGGGSNGSRVTRPLTISTNRYPLNLLFSTAYRFFGEHILPNTRLGEQFIALGCSCEQI